MTQTNPYPLPYQICPRCECLLKDPNSQEPTPKQFRGNRSPKLYRKGTTPCKCCASSSNSSGNPSGDEKTGPALNKSSLPSRPLMYQYPPNALLWPPPNKPPDKKKMRFSLCCKKKKTVKLDSAVQTSLIEVDDNKTQVSKIDIKTAGDNCRDPQLCQNARCPLSCCPDKKCYINNSTILPPNEPMVRSPRLNDDAIEALQSFIKAESRTNRRVMEDILAELDRQRRDIRELKEMFDVMVRLFKQNLFERTLNYGEELKKRIEEESRGRRRSGGGTEKFSGRKEEERGSISDDARSKSSLEPRNRAVPVTRSVDSKLGTINEKPEIPPLKVNLNRNSGGSNKEPKRLMGICGLCKTLFRKK